MSVQSAISTQSGSELDAVSDAIDKVNVLKERAWDGESQFDKNMDKSKFRAYEVARDRVKEFYSEQHAKQTMEFNLKAQDDFDSRTRARMGVWEAIERLNGLVDESDPDTSLSQIKHLFQTAEAIRNDKKPEWMQVVGLVHDLGKLLAFFGSEGQWDVVGDTFVVGCKFSDKIIHSETFSKNPDSSHEIYSTEYGIYKPNCGLDSVMLSWGHDEYLYRVFKSNHCDLPPEGLAMIRYHSFYPWHQDGAYRHLMNETDEHMLLAVQSFNPYDLYSKNEGPCDVEKLRPYYQTLISKFFPSELDW